MGANMSFFDDVQEYPPDQIYGLIQAYNMESNPKKVDVSIGVYKNSSLKPECMTVVKKAEKVLMQQEGPKSYLPIDGDPEFTMLTAKLLFGDDAPLERVYGAQVPGGTGGLRIIGEFLVELGYKRIALPIPTWANHRLIFTSAGLDLHLYSHYDEQSGKLMIDEMVEQLADLPEKTAVLFHGCCHNPTGLDPTQEEWKRLSKVCKDHGVLPVFDVAYHGLGQGISEDAFAVRHFMSEGHEMLVANSFSKSFGLYGERVGVIFALTEIENRAAALVSAVKRCIRGVYSTPPRHGALIVAKILADDELRKEWDEELQEMRNRISAVRKLLIDRLSTKLHQDFSYINERKGMFIQIGLSEDQVKMLRNEYAIYMPISGRVNLCGINNDNIDYIVDAIADVKNR
jgi:aspartate aminotransferase